ncbi:MAG: hypothetical protein KC912_09120 [Proteobacteria bacterium]|nr:hypothetical protein [Pseudomonadota bacterium]
MSTLRKSAGWLVASALLGAFGLALAVGAAVGLASGLEYYLLPYEQRIESELRFMYGPGAGLGLFYGVFGTFLMCAMLLYTLRKWLIQVTALGNVVHWLRFHIICGVMGPVFILMHTAFETPRGLIAVGFWCMVLVALSGAFGRYVYGWFPRMQGGQALAWSEARETLLDLRGELVAATASSHGDQIGQAVSLVRDLDMQAHTVVGLWRLRGEMGRRRGEMNRLLASAGLPPEVQAHARGMLHEQLRLKGGVESMRVVGRLFRYWHLFHRPLAGAMYLIVSLHVLTAILFGGAIGTLMELFT